MHVLLEAFLDVATTIFLASPPCDALYDIFSQRFLFLHCFLSLGGSILYKYTYFRGAPSKTHEHTLRAYKTLAAQSRLILLQAGTGSLLNVTQLVAANYLQK